MVFNRIGTHEWQKRAVGLGVENGPVASIPLTFTPARKLRVKKKWRLFLQNTLAKIAVTIERKTETGVARSGPFNMRVHCHGDHRILDNRSRSNLLSSPLLLRVSIPFFYIPSARRYFFFLESGVHLTRTSSFSSREPDFCRQESRALLQSRARQKNNTVITLQFPWNPRAQQPARKLVHSTASQLYRLKQELIFLSHDYLFRLSANCVSLFTNTHWIVRGGRT